MTVPDLEGAVVAGVEDPVASGLLCPPPKSALDGLLLLDDTEKVPCDLS